MSTYACQCIHVGVYLSTYNCLNTPVHISVNCPNRRIVCNGHPSAISELGAWSAWRTCLRSGTLLSNVTFLDQWFRPARTGPRIRVRRVRTTFEHASSPCYVPTVHRKRADYSATLMALASKSSLLTASSLSAPGSVTQAMKLWRSEPLAPFRTRDTSVCLTSSSNQHYSLPSNETDSPYQARQGLHYSNANRPGLTGLIRRWRPCLPLCLLVIEWFTFWRHYYAPPREATQQPERRPLRKQTERRPTAS